MRRFALHLGAILLATAVLATGSAAGAAYEDANISLYHTEADLDSANETRTAILNWTAEPVVSNGATLDGNVLVGEALIVAIHSEQLAADLDAREEPPTERFFVLLDGDPGLLIHQRNYRQRFGPKVLRVGPQNTTVYRAGNTTYAVVDTGSVDVDRPGCEDQQSNRIEDHDEYAVDIADNVSTASANGPVFTAFRRPSEFDHPPNDPLPTDVVNLTVRIAIEAEEDHYVRMVLGDGRTANRSVKGPFTGPTGERVVRFDLRAVPPGTNYSVRLVHDGTVVDRANGTVQRPTATFADARFVTVDGQRRLNVTANLSHGGDLVSVAPNGRRRPLVRLAPGEASRVSIPLVRNEEVLLPEGGRLRAVRFDGTVYPDAVYELGDEGAPVRTPTATPTPSPTPDGHDRHSTPGPTGTAPGTESQPGFGAAVAALALLAWAAVAALAGRRDRGPGSG